MTRLKIATFLTLASLLLPLLLSGASSLRSEIIGYLPRTTGEVAYIDLQEVRRSPHYQTIKQRVVPARFADFERFVRLLGVNVDTDLDWLAWGLVSGKGDAEYFFGIVQGRFDEDRIQGYYDANQLPTAEYLGETLYLYGEADSSQSYALVLLDRSTGAFGTRASLEMILDTRQGTSPNLNQNTAFAARIAEVNGRTPVWIVMDEYYTRLAMSQLLPELAKFQEFNTLASRFQAAQARITLGRDVNLNLTIHCEQPADAQTFAFLLQTGLTAQGWQAQQDAPELNTVLSRADVRSAGRLLRVNLVARESELRALLAKNVKLFP